MMKMKCVMTAALAMMLVVPFAQATDFKAPAEDAMNPAPTVQLNAFQRFELVDVGIDPPYAGQDSNEVARQYLQGNVSDRVGKVIAAWNEQPAADAPRTLKIEPKIAHIRFITGGKRFFAGAMAGSSWVHVTVKMTDAATGEVIAEPAFYQVGSGRMGGISFGATDKTMLIRISSMLRAYLQKNYEGQVEIPVRVAPQVED